MNSKTHSTLPCCTLEPRAGHDKKAENLSHMILIKECYCIMWDALKQLVRRNGKTFVASDLMFCKSTAGRKQVDFPYDAQHHMWSEHRHKQNTSNYFKPTSKRCELTFLPFFIQVIRGLGSPTAWHTKDATPPEIPVWSSGVLMKLGMPVRERERDIKIKYQFIA